MLIYKFNVIKLKMKCEKCSNEAEYNYEYFSKPAYCRKHKNHFMIYKTDNICCIL
jgi:hypothetical protein